MEAAVAATIEPVKAHSAGGGEDGGESGDHGRQQRQSWVSLAANCCLLLAGGGGGALLAWWALSFHDSNEQLWMVPVGLVLLGTPVFAWLSIFGGGASSGACGNLKLLSARPPDLESTCHATN